PFATRCPQASPRHQVSHRRHFHSQRRAHRRHRRRAIPPVPRPQDKTLHPETDTPHPLTPPLAHARTYGARHGSSLRPHRPHRPARGCPRTTRSTENSINTSGSRWQTHAIEGSILHADRGSTLGAV